MKKIYYLAVSLMLLAVNNNIAQAQSNKIISAVAQKAGNTSGVTLMIDRTAFENNGLKKGDVFLMDIGLSESREMKVKRVSSYIPGTRSYQVVSTTDSNELFTFTYSKGGINGIYHLDHDEAIYFLKDTGKNQNFLTTDETILPEQQACSVHNDSHEFVTQALPSFSPKNKSNGQKKVESSAAPLLDAPTDTTVIDLMLVYTEKAEEWALNSTTYADIDEVLAESINRSQTALDNSGIPIELRVVHVHNNTTYTDDTGDENDEIDAGTHLRRFTQNDSDPIFDSEYNGYMQEIHDLRDQYGADLVAAIMNEPETGGIAWRLSQTNGSPWYGFSVNRVQQIASGTTLIHEIGHNMGNAHSRTQGSDSRASEVGGLFHFSVGYQDYIHGFVTVMAYDTPTTSRAPIFSSPELEWQGEPTGTNNVRTPENNALSMSLIKRTIANYRNSVELSPSVTLSTEDISVNLNREDELEIAIDVSNTGESPLMWEVDFDYPDQFSSKSRPVASSISIEESAEGMDISELKPFYYVADEQQNNRFKMAEEPSVLFETSFESSEGYEKGHAEGMKGWQSRQGFAITTENPLTGNNHLQVSGGDGGSIYTYSPFLGYLTFGEYSSEISFSYTGDNSNSANYFDLSWYDGKTSDYSNYLIIANNALYVGETNEFGELDFFSSGVTIDPDQYYTYKVHFNLTEGTNDHYIDGNLVYQSESLSGNTPSYLRILRRQGADNTIDVDDIKFTKDASPTRWLNFEDEGLVGFVRDGSQGQIRFKVNTVDIDAGTYRTKLQVRTNDPENTLIEVPVELTVNQAVSNEVDDQPARIKLAQNYPNPFNPSTTIKYTLQEAGEVQLDVFNIQGQKVATLLNNKKTAAGEHQVNFDASNFASGIYIYRLKTAGETLTRQMVLIK